MRPAGHAATLCAQFGCAICRSMHEGTALSRRPKPFVDRRSRLYEADGCATLRAVPRADGCSGTHPCSDSAPVQRSESADQSFERVFQARVVEAKTGLLQNPRAHVRAFQEHLTELAERGAQREVGHREQGGPAHNAA